MKQIIEKAAVLFNFKLEAVRANLLGNSANMVYELGVGDTAYIMRLSQQPCHVLPKYQSEMEWVNYLSEHGVHTSRALASVNSNYVEMIEHDSSCFFVSLFNKAKGRPPNTENRDEWNNSLFIHWGQTMGKMHALAKKYQAEHGFLVRSHWNEDIYFSAEYATDPTEEKIDTVWKGIITELSQLPKELDSYGLIHYDFHQYNFFINDGSLTVYDFDDCLYHWYVCDIAVSLYHALQSVPKSNIQARKRFANDFLSAFLDGYTRENMLADLWLNKVPLFLEYRRICSYKFAKYLWSSGPVEEWQSELLNVLRNDIENKVPYADITMAV